MSEFVGRYTFTCSVCSARAEEPGIWVLGAGVVVPNPTLPDGWHTYNGRDLCPDHKVAVLKRTTL